MLTLVICIDAFAATSFPVMLGGRDDGRAIAGYTAQAAEFWSPEVACCEVSCWGVVVAALRSRICL